jgi:glycosyltransferase 2 family protein
LKVGSWERLRNKFIIGLVLGIVVLVGLSLFADIRTLPQTLATFRWELLPLILGLTLLNYGLRFVKWQYYLRLVGVRGVGTGDSLSIFLGGMTMAMTPGKVGELLKAYMLRQVSGAPMSSTAPIIAAERLTDGLAMVILAAVGMIVYPFGWQALAAFTAIALAVILVAQSRRLVHALLGRAERLPVVSRFAHSLYSLYDSTYLVLRWKPLLIAVGLGVISWTGECLAFYLVLVGLGLPGDLTLLLQATFILAMATLVGAVSMLPGGLGAADASVTGLLLLLVASPLMTQPVAVAATLLIRFCTLWFGVLLGIGALAVTGRRLLNAPAAPAEVATPAPVGARPGR